MAGTITRKTYGTWIAGQRNALNTAFSAALAVLDGRVANQVDSGAVDSLKLRAEVANQYFTEKFADGTLRLGAIDTRFLRADHAVGFFTYVYAVHRTPEAWLVSEAFEALQDVQAYHDGREIPDRVTYAAPGGFWARLRGEKADPERMAKAQLATVTLALVDAAPQADKATLKASLQWSRLKGLAELQNELRELLDSIVGQLVFQFDGHAGDEPFERIEGMDPLDQVELGQQLLAVLPTTEEGREYLIKLIAIDETAGGMTAAQKRLIRSPAHPGQVRRVLAAFKFNSQTWEVEPVTSGDLWKKVPDPESNVEKILSASAKGSKTALKIYATYGATAASAMQLSQVKHPTLEAAPGMVTKVKLLFTRDVSWPESESPPPGATAKRVAVVNVLASAVSLVLQWDKFRNSEIQPGAPPISGADMLAMANAVNSMLSANVAFGKAFEPDYYSKSGGKQTARFLSHVTVALSVVDYGLSLQDAWKAQTLEEAAAHGAKAGAAALTALSTMLGALRAVPHPAAFALGLAASLITWAAGRWLAQIKRDEAAALLGGTYFGKDSHPKRLKRINDTTVSLVEGEGFEDLRFAMIERSPDGTREDFARQIAIVAGAAGMFTFTWDRSSLLSVRISSGRKLEGFTELPSGSAAALKDTLLPAGSELNLYDASHERADSQSNFTVLSDRLDDVTIDGRLPLKLTRGFFDPTREITEAARDILAQEAFLHASLGDLIRTELIEAEITTPAPAWPATSQERVSGADADIPNMRIILRDRL